MSEPSSTDEPPAPAAPSRWQHPAVAVVSALVGVALGAVLAGVFGLANTYAQQAGTTQESLRTQRQTAYTEFLTQHQLFTQASQDHVLTVLKNKQADTGAIEKSYNDLDETYKKLTAAVSSVDIVGTTEVAAYAERLYSADNTLHAASFGLQTVATKPELRSNVEAMTKAVSDAMDAKDIQDSFVAFATRARDDVSSD